MSDSLLRHDWTADEIEEIYNLPLLNLVYRAASVHRRFFNPREIKVSSLLSVKTGGCSEDCKYCSQSSYYKTGTQDEPMLSVDQVLEAARKARQDGATRFCLSTAWRNLEEKELPVIVQMIEGVKKLNLEVCATMGSLTDRQARQLKEAGLDAYNHNLDSGRQYYDKIISTRSYDDRLQTLQHVQDAGIRLCSGGIIGMGESHEDRIDLLRHLSNLNPHPESTPINILVPIEGAPLERDANFSFWDLLRTVATAKILMGATYVRLSAGRKELSDIETAFCFLAGANSIFMGEKLLTTQNTEVDRDQALFDLLGLVKKEPETSSVTGSIGSVSG